jgi:ABC-type amino acid transport substrate-binding protein
MTRCKQLTLRSLVIIFTCISLSVNATDRAGYLVTDVSWEPYWITKGDMSKGILNDVMLELDNRLSVSLYPSSPLSVRRSKIAFNKGDFEIECCVNIAWRNSKQDQSVSVWSDTVLMVEEVLVFPKGKAFKFESLQDLSDRYISTVRGYGYVGEALFKRADSVSNITQISQVSLRRSDAAIIDKAELAYIQQHEPELANMWQHIELGPVINRSALKIRVHISRADLIGPINDALQVMKDEGVIEDIAHRYY